MNKQVIIALLGTATRAQFTKSKVCPFEDDKQQVIIRKTADPAYVDSDDCADLCYDEANNIGSTDGLCCFHTTYHAVEYDMYFGDCVLGKVSQIMPAEPMEIEGVNVEFEAFLMGNPSKDMNMTMEGSDEENRKDGSGKIQSYSGDVEVDYDLAYMFAPEDWGMSKWKDSYFCGGIEDPEEDAIAQAFPEENGWKGFESRDECFEWCKEQRKELGYGTCCGNAYINEDIQKNPKQMRYCGLFDSPVGDYEYYEDDITGSRANFFSSRPLGEKEDREEGGMMSEASMWFEDTFGSSSAQNMAAFVSLVAAAASVYSI